VNLLIVDDERLARAELRRLLRDFPAVEIVGEARSVEDAVEQATQLEPDVILLDIEMPGGTGFDVLERLERVPLVVFTTAYDAHAVKAFEVAALDYLLKPVDARRLREALDRAAVRLGGAAGDTKEPRPKFLERMLVRDGSLCLMVDFRDVLLLESEGNYTRLHLSQLSQTPLLARSLHHLEERLDPAVFFRANRRELVSLKHVERIEPHRESAGIVLHLRGGRLVELSRRQAQRFRQLG
jgi:two-component system LytT family response regulator